MPDTSAVKSTPGSAISNAIWNAFGSFWSIAMGFALAPILIWHLGTNQYGILLIIWSVTGILGVMNFGMGEATLRFAAMYFGKGDLAGVNRVMGLTLTFYLVICAVAVAGLFIGAPQLVRTFDIPTEQAELVGWLLRLSALIFSLGVVSRAYGAIPMALLRYDVSTKIGVVQSVARASGYIVLVMLGFSLAQIVAWDLMILVGTLVVQAIVIRRIAPGVRLSPTFSFKGMKEVFSFSIYSFLTYVFFTLHKESGKLILGAKLGPTPVAHLGTPDNVSQRLHGVVSSGSETLMPRFSGTSDASTIGSLFRNGTWGSLAVSLVIFVPLIVLMRDFLTLWINPEFAEASAVVGQFVALSYISQGAFAPVATYFRGAGKPWVVTITVAAAGLCMVGSSVILIPRYGIAGIGYAYALSSAPALLGVTYGWFRIFGAASLLGFLRVVAMPLAMAALAYWIQIEIHARLPATTWGHLLFIGMAFAGITVGLVFGADWLAGGADAPSRRFASSAIASPRIAALLRRLPINRTRDGP